MIETHHDVHNVTHPNRPRNDFAYFFGFSATFAK